MDAVCLSVKIQLNFYKHFILQRHYNIVNLPGVLILPKYIFKPVLQSMSGVTSVSSYPTYLSTFLYSLSIIHSCL